MREDGGEMMREDGGRDDERRWMGGGMVTEDGWGGLVRMCQLLNSHDTVRRSLVVRYHMPDYFYKAEFPVI